MLYKLPLALAVAVDPSPSRRWLDSLSESYGLTDFECDFGQAA